MESDDLIASVYHKIEREKALIHAATNMHHSTDNPLVQHTLDSNIRDSRKNIAYLEEKMKELQLRRVDHDSSASPSGYRSRHPASNVAARGPERGQFHGQYPDRSDSMPASREPKARPNYSKLGVLYSTLFVLHLLPLASFFFFFFLLFLFLFFFVV